MVEMVRLLHKIHHAPGTITERAQELQELYISGKRHLAMPQTAAPTCQGQPLDLERRSIDRGTACDTVTTADAAQLDDHELAQS